MAKGEGHVLRNTKVGLGGLVVIMLATGPKVRECKRGQERWTFKDDTNLQLTFLRRVSKAVCPML
jgi:hypothetical protein